MERREFIGRTLKSGGLAALTLAGLARQGAKAAPRADVVLITGTSSGFGARMALTFARAGYRTYASMREPDGRNRDSADALRATAQRENLALFVEELDVLSNDQAAALVNAIVAREGRLDILVNNAGILVYTPVDIVPPALWQLQMSVNVFAPMALAGLVLPHMRTRGSGLVIQVSSRVGRVIIPGIGLYCTSKLAFEAASEAAHYEATPYGIDFAIVQPTAFATDINMNARALFQSTTLPLLREQRPEGMQAHARFLEKLDRDFSGNPTRNPQEVADLALSIAQTPRHDRVLRYPVGDEGELAAVRRANAFCASLQAESLQAAGYGELYRG